jgi:TRAP transporter TAXI family solute receptor
MIGRGRRSAGVALALALSLCACGRTDVPWRTRALVRLTTGTPGASFYPLGQSLAREYAEILPDIQVLVSESGGSVTNVEALQNGEADIGFAYADVAYMASAGRLAETTQPSERLRAIAVLRLTPLHVVVRAASAIHTIADLRRRHVNVGPRGSGTALTASVVLRAFGIDAAHMRIETLPHNDAAARLGTGTLDAMFVGASYPAESVVTATRAGARLLAVSGPAIDRLRREYPFLRPTIIHADTYAHHSSSVRTIGVDSVFVCRSDLDEPLVYRLTKAFFEVLPRLAVEQEWLRQMDLDQAFAAPIPLHEGAARYYRERELAQ